MKQLTIYRILTFILLPFAILLGGTGVLMLLIALANPQLLLQVFITAGFVFYTFSTLRFLTRHIDPERPAKVSTRDWIRVNAIVAAFLALRSIYSFIVSITMSQAEVKKTFDQLKELQPSFSSINLNFYSTVVQFAAYLSLAFGAILLIHVLMSFKVLKKYGYLFSITKENSSQ
jgi:cytochrome b561